MRAQASLFIVIGVILLAVVGLFSMLNTKEPKVETPANLETTAVKEYVEQCLEETTKEGLQALGLRGGYYEATFISLTTEYVDIPYYYYLDDVSQVLTPPEMLAELQKYIDANAGTCLASANLPGYSVSAGVPRAKARLGDEKVLVELNMPITVEREGSQTVVNGFTAEAPVRLNAIYNIANSIITETLMDPYFIHVTSVLELSEKYEMQIDTIKFTDNAIVYVLQDNKTIYNGEPYMFLFGVLLDGENSPPELIAPDVLEGKVGEYMFYQFKANDREGQHLLFSVDDEYAFNSLNGEFGFMPEQPGEYALHINVTDGVDTTSKLIRVIVR
jgi:hypothetical protein